MVGEVLENLVLSGVFHDRIICTGKEFAQVFCSPYNRGFDFLAPPE